MSSTVTLNRIWSAASILSVKWSHGLESNKAHRVLHYLLCRLYDEGRGHLMNAQLTLAQTTLSKKLGISRQWIGTLTNRLEREGWIEHHSSKGPDGKNESTIWRIGRQFKRLLVMLSKSKRGKPQQNQADKCSWRFSPLKRVKRLFSILSEETDPTPEELAALPPRLRGFAATGKAAESGKVPRYGE